MFKDINNYIYNIYNKMQTYFNKDLIECGLDECARGCIFGRIYSACVIFPKDINELDLQIKDSKKLSKKKREQVYEYIEQNIWRDSFFSKLYKILIPDKGDTVVLRHGRWSNLSGRITKCNSKNSYNIKLTKSLNPYHNDIPKKRIIRHREDFYVDKS